MINYDCQCRLARTLFAPATAFGLGHLVNKWFKPDFETRDLWLLVAANTLTGGLAYGSFILFPIKD